MTSAQNENLLVVLQNVVLTCFTKFLKIGLEGSAIADEL